MVHPWEPFNEINWKTAGVFFGILVLVWLVASIETHSILGGFLWTLGIFLVITFIGKLGG